MQRPLSHPRGRGELDLTFARTQSVSLRDHLDGCEEVLLLGATVGLELDRLINRYSRVAPAKALMLQAIGAERIEALCDAFCHELGVELSQCGEMRPRFSPGYGDLPLELQRDIFRVLDCPRKIGLTLNDSLLMTPTKSVTALVGFETDGGTHKNVGCSTCEKGNCLYRRNI